MTTDSQGAVSPNSFNLSDFTDQTGEEPAPVAEEAEETPAEPEGQEKEDAPQGDDDTGDDDAADDDEDDGEGEEPQRQRPRRSSQKRINEAIRKQRDAERDAEYWRAKALGDRSPDADKPTPKPEENARPNASDYTYGETDPEFIEALVDWKADQRLAAKLSEFRQTTEAEGQVKQLQQSYNARVAEAAEKYPDFEDVVTQGAARGEWPCSEAMGLAILASDSGPDLAYHFATNKADAVRIAAMNPLDQAREIGRLEAKLSAPEPDPAPAPKTTNAPPPPQTRTRGSGGQFENPERALYKKMLTEFR